VVIVAAADGSVATSTPELTQAGLITVPGVMVLAVMAVSIAVANTSIQELSGTGGIATRSGIKISPFSKKMPGVPVLPPCTWSINADITPTKLVTPAKGIGVGDRARMLLDKLFTLGSIILFVPF
jgi:hypothetical protein